MKALLIALTLAGSLAQAKVKTETVNYKEGNTTLKGYLAYDDSHKEPRPGLVLVHEWMGLNDYAKRRAREMAEKGYIVLAADIYGNGMTTKNPKEAGQLAGKYKNDRALFRKRMQAALDTLKAQKGVETSKIAAMGYCFGGTGVLELARSGADIKGVISFHGGLGSPTPADAKNIKAKVLVLHGAVDPNVPPEEVAAFQKEMNDAHVDYQLVAYSDTVHAFTNPDSGNDPSKGAAYNAVSERRSIVALHDFLDEVLK